MIMVKLVVKEFFMKKNEWIRIILAYWYVLANRDAVLK